MPVSGLVITLSEDQAARAAALAAMASEKRIELGEPQGMRLPIVVETLDAGEDKEVWQWLHALEGVTFVDVACIHFDEEESVHSKEVRA